MKLDAAHDLRCQMHCTLNAILRAHVAVLYIHTFVLVLPFVYTASRKRSMYYVYVQTVHRERERERAHSMQCNSCGIGEKFPPWPKPKPLAENEKHKQLLNIVAFHEKYFEIQFSERAFRTKYLKMILI